MQTTVPDNLEQYLTVTRAAMMLGVSADTLRNWDKTGQLKAFRHPLNQYRLYSRDDLPAFLDRIRGSQDDGEASNE